MLFRVFILFSLVSLAVSYDVTSEISRSELIEAAELYCCQFRKCECETVNKLPYLTAALNSISLYGYKVKSYLQLVCQQEYYVMGLSCDHAMKFKLAYIAGYLLPLRQSFSNRIRNVSNYFGPVAPHYNGMKIINPTTDCIETPVPTSVAYGSVARECIIPVSNEWCGTSRSLQSRCNYTPTLQLRVTGNYKVCVGGLNKKPVIINRFKSSKFGLCYARRDILLPSFANYINGVLNEFYKLVTYNTTHLQIDVFNSTSFEDLIQHININKTLTGIRPISKSLSYLCYSKIHLNISFWLFDIYVANSHCDVGYIRYNETHSVCKTALFDHNIICPDILFRDNDDYIRYTYPIDIKLSTNYANNFNLEPMSELSNVISQAIKNQTNAFLNFNSKIVQSVTNQTDLNLIVDAINRLTSEVLSSNNFNRVMSNLKNSILKLQNLNVTVNDFEDLISRFKNITLSIKQLDAIDNTLKTLKNLTIDISEKSFKNLSFNLQNIDQLKNLNVTITNIITACNDTGDFLYCALSKSIDYTVTSLNKTNTQLIDYAISILFNSSKIDYDNVTLLGDTPLVGNFITDAFAALLRPFFKLFVLTFKLIVEETVVIIDILAKALSETFESLVGAIKSITITLIKLITTIFALLESQFLLFEYIFLFLFILYFIFNNSIFAFIVVFLLMLVFGLDRKSPSILLYFINPDFVYINLTNYYLSNFSWDYRFGITTGGYAYHYYLNGTTAILEI